MPPPAPLSLRAAESSDDMRGFTYMPLRDFLSRRHYYRRAAATPERLLRASLSHAPVSLAADIGQYLFIAAASIF